MIANILTLPLNAFDGKPNAEETKEKYRIRHSLIIEQLAIQKISAIFHFGEIAQWRVENGISRGFKAIVRYWQNKYPGEPCWILEDDTRFTHPMASAYYLANIPSDYDIYAGSISGGNIDENNITIDFSGFQCIIIHPRFFDTFLMLSEQRDIDRELTDRTGGKLTPKGKFVVCDKFVAVSHNVYSLHFNEVKDYSDKFKGRPLYND